MSAPEPTAAEVIAEAVQSVTDLWDEPLDEVHDIPPLVRAVVAAIRAMSPQQQAELCPAAVAGALHAAADAMTFDASLRSDERCGAMNDTAHWLRRRADGITERGAS